LNETAAHTAVIARSPCDEAIQPVPGALDCFVAPLLAMTACASRAPFINMKFSKEAQFREFPRNQRKPDALSLVFEFGGGLS
jgi:hypothetical protein